MNRLMDISFFASAKTCCMITNIDYDEQLTTSCCTIVSDVYQGQNELQQLDIDYKISQFHPIVLPNLFASQINPFATGLSIELPQHYIPPLLSQNNLLVQYQVFII